MSTLLFVQLALDRIIVLSASFTGDLAFTAAPEPLILVFHYQLLPRPHKAYDGRC